MESFETEEPKWRTLARKWRPRPTTWLTRSPRTRAGLSLSLGIALLAAMAPAATRAQSAADDAGGEQDIVLGTTEPNYKFPWVVEIQANAGPGRGVLIAPNWVLTAAHVVSSPLDKNGVTVTYSRTSPAGAGTSGSQQTGVGSVFIHPEYDARNLKADLALVRLRQPFAADPYLEVAELPFAVPAAGQVGTIASNMSHTSPVPPGYDAVIRPAVTSVGTEGSFSAVAQNGSVCPGDSGSGFVTSSGGRNFVTGIVSGTLSDDCVTPGRIIQLADVSHYVTWVRQKAELWNAQIYKTDGGGGIQQLRNYGNFRESWGEILPAAFNGDKWSDLSFYDPNAGHLEHYSTDGKGKLAQMTAHGGVRTTWDIIVPGNFGGSFHTDLFFYDRESGTGQFYTSDGSGRIKELRTQPELRTTWDIIIPGEFGGADWTDLLFYDRETNLVQIYSCDGGGGIQELAHYYDWPIYDLIVPGNFDGDELTDLLFYDRAAGRGDFFTSTGSGGLQRLKTYEGWRTTWNQIVPGNFGGDGLTDLLFYDRGAGWGEFYKNNGGATFTKLREQPNWRTTWTKIVPGTFGGNKWTDLLFYEGPAGPTLPR